MPVRIIHEGPVSWVVIDREDKGNSLDYAHAVELAHRINEACNYKDTSAVAIRGAGSRFFSTGVDLESVASVEGVEDAWRLMYEGLGGVCRALSSCDKPVIAAVNGHAVGIGFELLYASDLAYAVEYAKMGSPAVKWGMVPPASTTIAPWIVGYKQAAYVALTGELFSAREAQAMGFINGVVESVEQLVETVMGVAEKIAGNDQWAVRTAKSLLRGARLHLQLERGLLALAYSTARPETRERARGFLERKR